MTQAFVWPRVLASLSGVAFALAIALMYRHIEQERAEGHADLTWAETVLGLTLVGDLALVCGAVIWFGRPAAWLRRLGVGVLSVATLGSVSAAPLLALWLLLALPSLDVFRGGSTTDEGGQPA